MENLEVSKIIHKARGLKWHAKGDTHEYRDGVNLFDCTCGEKKLYSSLLSFHIERNPNYTAPTAYLEVMAWARVDIAFYEDFTEYLKDKISKDTSFIGEITPDVMTRCVLNILLDPNSALMLSLNSWKGGKDEENSTPWRLSLSGM